MSTSVSLRGGCVFPRYTVIGEMSHSRAGCLVSVLPLELATPAVDIAKPKLVGFADSITVLDPGGRSSATVRRDVARCCNRYGSR